MFLSVLTRSSRHDLIALATVRTRLLDGDTSEDSLLQTLITNASSDMAGYWGRPFARQRYRLKLSGDGGRGILLPVYPIDPDSVTVTIDGTAETDFVVYDKDAGLIYRGSRWTHTTDTDDPLNVVVTWHAGYILPDQISTFAATTAVTGGSWVRPSTPTLSPLLFEVTTAGTTDASEPTWPTTAGDTVTSGTAVFTGRDVEELPARISDLAYVEVYNRYTQSDRAPGLVSQSADGFSETFAAAQIESHLSSPVRSGLDSMRTGVMV